MKKLAAYFVVAVLTVTATANPITPTPDPDKEWRCLVIKNPPYLLCGWWPKD